MAKKRKGKKKKFKKIVNFMAGVTTPDPADDREVLFVAQTDKPPKLKLRKRKTVGIKLGQAEETGLQFDKVFGLEKKQKGLFNAKIGIDPDFGKMAFDKNLDFSKGFVAQEFDFGESTMISDDFPEPSEDDFLEDFERDSERSVPTLLDSLPKITDPKKIPLTDEEDEESTGEKLTQKFLRVRQEALETGANPLTPEEERNFESSPKFTRNFGTTGKRAGASFGRF